MSICGIAPAEDDDGEAAQGRPQSRPQSAPAPHREPNQPIPTDTLPAQSTDPKRTDAVRATIATLGLVQDDPRTKQLMPIIRKYCAMNDKKIASAPADDNQMALLLEALRNIK
jgi:hypothetical protein